MRILVNVGASSPDLADHLKTLPARSRAARVRALAQIGLLMEKSLKAGIAPVVQESESGQIDPSHAHDAGFVDSMRAFGL